ncbi:hypothetical protein P879_05954 [Paragonimus westermani]|uniref:Uncharacterized protein n=1 Tax=Paragonimus westermani TaxID=34504 RepID=A0A8T0DQP3_9TREM|nr:hypothetical protein P879_05954 [Paragonimus westermani]
MLGCCTYFGIRLPCSESGRHTSVNCVFHCSSQNVESQEKGDHCTLQKTNFTKYSAFGRYT